MDAKTQCNTTSILDHFNERVSTLNWSDVIKFNAKYDVELKNASLLVWPFLLDISKSTLKNQHSRQWSTLFHRAFLKFYLEKLSSFTYKIFVYEINLARKNNLLKSITKEERYIEFCDSLKNTDKLIEIYIKYDVLFERLCELSKNLQLFLNEHLENLEKDLPFLNQQFSTDIIQSVQKVEFGCSDLHYGAKTSIIYYFSDSGLVYKPRNLSVDILLQTIHSHLNKTFSFQFEHSTSFSNHNSNYGWQKLVKPNVKFTKTTIEDVYSLFGAHMAVFYALNCTDLHYENIIFSQNNSPVFIDVETLFENQNFADSIEDSMNTGAELAIVKMIKDSVLQSALLPLKGTELEDINGLTHSDNVTIKQNIDYFVNKSTDQLKIERKPGDFKVTPVVPKINGVQPKAYEYKKYILEGFKKTIEHILENKEKYISIVSQHMPESTRQVYRNTQFYVSILNESTHPLYACSEDALEDLFNRLEIEAEVKPYLYKIVAFETKALKKFDIPSFSSSMCSNTLFSDMHYEIKDFFKSSSFDAFSKKINSISPESINFQLKIIDRVLTPSVEFYDEEYTSSSVHSLLNKLVKSIMDEMHICEQTQTVSWFGLKGPIDSDNELIHSIASPDLYQGLAGLLIAFEEFSIWEPCNSDINNMKHRLLNSILFHIDNWQEEAFGLMDGYVGLLYSVLVYSHRNNKPELISKVEAITIIKAEKLKNNLYDIVSGEAGIILFLCYLYYLNPSHKILDIAICLADNLIHSADITDEKIFWKTTDAKKHLLGFSHGSSGIAHALVSLYRVSSNKKYLNFAKRVLKCEDSFFSKECGYWPDFRTSPPSQSLSWCNGTLGILLTRIINSDLIDLSNKKEMINICLKKLLAIKNQDHSICHGIYGIVELIEHIDDESLISYKHSIKDYINDILAKTNIYNSGWIDDPFNIGLFPGKTGSAYVLARYLNEYKGTNSILTITNLRAL